MILKSAGATSVSSCLSCINLATQVQADETATQIEAGGPSSFQDRLGQSM